MFRLAMAFVVATACLSAGCGGDSGGGEPSDESGGNVAHKLKYEPAIVELRGKLKIEPKFGPPGYGETPAEDEKTYICVLKLDVPVDVLGDSASDTNTETVTNVEEIQLSTSEESVFRDCRAGKNAVVQGTLFHSITGHHYTDVLMTLNKIETK